MSDRISWIIPDVEPEACALFFQSSRNMLKASHGEVTASSLKLRIRGGHRPSQSLAKSKFASVCVSVCVCRSFCLQPAACRLFTEIRLPGFMFMTMVRRSLFRRVEPPCEAESFSLCLFILQAIPLAQIPAPICEITVDGCEEGLEYEVGDSISSEYQAQCF